MKANLFFCVLLLSLLCSCSPNEKSVQCDVLVLGDGTGAAAAAIQSARSGARTILVNPQPWLGGMLTSAGVSATDGNHRLPAGLWAEFRQHLRDHYGGADALFTGWVSNTMFEPHVGAFYWRQMAEREMLLEVWFESDWEKIEQTAGWQVAVRQKDGTLRRVEAKILIDGTDLGDVAAAAGATYDLGMEARSVSGEAMAPEQANDIIQDLTYVAILKDFGEGADKTIPRPEGYDPAEFRCACRHDCDEETAHPCETMLSYGKLPNGKYMINWPIEGNDYYANVVNMSDAERAEAYEKAKNYTLQFVYYIQHELGFKHLGLADDEFPTGDQLALMPYHREGRRFHGLTRLNVNHLTRPYDYPLYRTGIAVGDYPIDHHHDKNPAAPEIEFPKVPSFSIPAGALIPQDVPNLLIADKPISVSNIVNGSSRLQPVVIQIGQVAGLMGALAARLDRTPAELDLREVQNSLLEADGYLLPLIDVTPEHPHFAAIHRVAATGILHARGVPYQWANQTWFDPDTTLTAGQLTQNLHDFDEDLGRTIQSLSLNEQKTLTIGDAIQLTASMVRFFNLYSGTFSSADEVAAHVEKNWSALYQLPDFNLARPIKKAEMAVLLDRVIDPFHLKKVDFSGKWIQNGKLKMDN